MCVYVLSSWDEQNCHITGVRGVYSSIDELKSALMQGLDMGIFNYRKHVVDLIFSDVAIEKFKLDEWRS